MIVNCKIVQIDNVNNITYADGSTHRHKCVWITPNDPKEKVQWTTLVELRDEKIEEFDATGRKEGDTVPVRFKPSHFRVKRGGVETGEYKSICFIDFFNGGQANG